MTPGFLTATNPIQHTMHEKELLVSFARSRLYGEVDTAASEHSAVLIADRRSSLRCRWDAETEELLGCERLGLWG